MTRGRSSHAGARSARRSEPWTCLGLGLLLLAGAGLARAGEPAEEELQRLPATVRYVSGGVVYLDVGSARGVRVGDLVLVTLSGGEELRLRVVATSSDNASAGLESGRSAEVLPPGQPVTILIHKRPPAAGTPPAGAASGADGLWEGAEPTWGQDLPPGFQPLLAPVTGPGAGRARREEPPFTLDGRVTLSGTYYQDQEVDRRWSRLRAYVDMETRRLAGSEWRAVVRLSGNAQYERGEDDDYQARLHELYAEHAPRDGSHRLRLGRFFFDPLPSVGQLDGAHGEVRLGESPLAIGLAGGFLPTLSQEAPDPHRAGGVVYLAWRSDPTASTGFEGALGYHGTVDDSRFDRSALLARQQLRLFDLLFLSGQEDVDFYDSDDERSGVRLTRAYVDLRLQPARWLSVGVGYDRNELVDTVQLREDYPSLLDVRDTLGERYYVYARESAPWGLSFGQRVAYIVRRTQEDQIALTLDAAKLGIFSPGDAVRVGYYGLFGGTSEVHTPYVELNKELPAQFNVYFRYRLQQIQPTVGEDLTQHELTGGVSWAISRLYLQVEGSWITGDDVDAYRGFASATWRF